MKPFNLKDFKLGKKVVTRNGKEVTQLVHFENLKGRYCLFGVIDDSVCCFNKEGRYLDGFDVDSENDLFHPEEDDAEMWINVYSHFVMGRRITGGMIYESKDEAERSSKVMSDFLGSFKLVKE